MRTEARGLRRGLARQVRRWALAALVVGGCAAPDPSVAPLTPPPIAPGSRTLSEVVWTPVVVPGGGDVYRIEHVAANQTDLVAIGYDEAGQGSRGAIWHSNDGINFERVDGDLTGAVSLVDVAAGPTGFVVVGLEGMGPDIVVLVSRDGRQWERVPAAEALTAATVHAVAGDDASWLMVGAEPDGAPLAWMSRDGLDWERRDAAGLGINANAVLQDVAAALGSWPAVGAERVDSGALFSSESGAEWLTLLPSANGARPLRLTDIAVGEAATIVRGQAVPSCAPFTACVPIAVAWWSTDLESWGAMPADEALSAPSILLSGEFGFLTLEGSRASSSLDGLSWSALAAPADDRVLILDGVAFKDRVIAVGERTSAEVPLEPWLMSGALTLQ